jgi:hypothetical protein
MAANGYPLIPAVPGEKKPLRSWTPEYDAMMAGEYSVYKAFNRVPSDVGAAMMMGDLVASVDGDTHGEEGSTPSLAVLELLMETEWGLFDGCVLERTQSGGLHVYYNGIQFDKYPPGDSTWNIFMYAGGRMYQPDGGIGLEVLRGKHICYCYPTTTLKGSYKFESKNTLLNTRREELPSLPSCFSDRFGKATKDYVEDEKPINIVVDDKLEEEDFPVIIEYYMQNDFDCKHRNPAAWKFARCIWGLEYYGYHTTVGEVAVLVERYIKARGRDLHDPEEALRIAQYTKAKKSGPTKIPWTAVHAARRTRKERLLRRAW